MTVVRRYEYVIGIVLGMVFLTPLLLAGGFDTEETALGIFSSQVHYRHLLQGEWLFWFNDLGFGTPMPIGHRLDAHPAFALAGAGSLRLALSLLWIFQIAIASTYALRLLALGGVRPPLRLCLLTFYLFSVSSACWFYMNDWVTFVVGWTTLPALLIYLQRAIRCDDASRWPHLVTLALAFAFLILNSHPGYVAPLAVSLTIYALAAAPRRVTTYAGLFAALLFCLAVTSERLYFFATEAGFFHPSAVRVSQEEYTIGDYFRAMVVPFVSINGIASLRYAFIGPVFAVAALASFAWWRTHESHVRGCLVALVGSFALSLIPPRWFALYTAASGSWLFRDPILLFALLIGGGVLQRALDNRRLWLRTLVWGLLLVQGYQQWAALRPGVIEFRTKLPQRQFLPLTSPVRLTSVITPHTKTYGHRLYLSGLAQELVRGTLSQYGIRVVTDMTFDGLHPVTAWFKVVSMDRLYPSIAFMHGNIGGQRDVIANGPLLDALGIGLVLAEEREGPVPAGLVLLERIALQTVRGPYVLRLLGNADAWPPATVLSNEARDVPLPRRLGCPNDRALCRDFTSLVATRRASATSVTNGHGRYTVRLPPSEAERILFLSTTYRPEWRATSPEGGLDVEPIGMGFLGVRVPAGTETVDLTFMPVWRMRLAWFSAISALSMVFYLVVTRGRRR